MRTQRQENAAAAPPAVSYPGWIRINHDLRQRHVEAWARGYEAFGPPARWGADGAPAIVKIGEQARIAAQAGIVLVEEGHDMGDLTVRQTAALVNQINQLLAAALEVDPT